MFKLLIIKWLRSFQPPPHERNVIPLRSERGADTYHTLVIGEVVGNGEDYFFQDASFNLNVSFSLIKTPSSNKKPMV
jgi:hypothetical protein